MKRLILWSFGIAAFALLTHGGLDDSRGWHPKPDEPWYDSPWIVIGGALAVAFLWGLLEGLWRQRIARRALERIRRERIEEKRIALARDITPKAIVDDPISESRTPKRISGSACN